MKKNRGYGTAAIAMLVAACGMAGATRAESPGGGRGHYSTGDIRFAADAACFRYAPGDSTAWVEFYYSILRSDFSYLLIDSAHIANLYAWARVLDTAGTPLDSIANRFGSMIPSLDVIDANPDYKASYALSMVLEPGTYDVELVIADLHSKNTGQADFRIAVPSFADTLLFLSDIELASQIRTVPPRGPDDPIDVLVKNQRKVLPDAGRVLYPSRRVLYFYTEVYNLTTGPDVDSLFEVSYQIRTPSDATFRDFGKRTIRKPGESSVLATAVEVADLPGGRYALRVAVTDRATGAIAATQRSFVKVIPETDTRPLTEEEARKMRDVILYVANKQDLETYDNLNLTGKASFLKEFWARRDPTPGDGDNEFKREYFKRINEANELYSSHLTVKDDGWRTDMGRIYIRYGPADDKEKYPSTMEQQPFEQWFYFNLPDQGEVYFIFQDEAGYGVYELVHSTARGEIRSHLWERMIQEGRLIR